MNDDGVEVPKVATLDGFIDAATGGTGLNLRDLSKGDKLKILTAHSTYELDILNPIGQKVNIRGSGDFFPQATEACLAESSLGSAFLKLGWILLDWRMEINHNGKMITISPVRVIILNGKPLIKSSSDKAH